MSGTMDTLRAAWPVIKSALARGQLFKPQCQLVEPDPDIQCDHDVRIPMVEGYELTANIFRSKERAAAGLQDPVIMCAHPYDNHLTSALGKTPFKGPPQQYRLINQQEGTPQFSTLTSWESPDPNFWVPEGYTLVNLNLPGYANSGGPPSSFTQHQGDAYRQAIAWVGEQPWCTGAVGLCGVSYLAISQYFAAAAPDGETAPEALTCICPWEGLSDMYRDAVCIGGVADERFLPFWWHTEVKDSLNDLDGYIAMEGSTAEDFLTDHPLIDEHWAAKAAALRDIRVPMLVCASFSDHELHSMGSARAYEEASSEQKWMYTHRTGKWVSFYSGEAKSLMKDFMDRFLKGAANRFDTLPPIRLEVRRSRNEIHEVRWEQDWPLPQTSYRTLYLCKRGLSESEQPKARELVYDARKGQLTFDHTFAEDTEVSGYIRLDAFVEVRPRMKGDPQPEDMVLCAFIDKLDKKGRPVRFNGAVGNENDVVTRGYLRVSRRALDPERSRPWRPEYLGTSEEPLSAGEVVPVTIAFRPSSTFFAKGDGLRLIISPRDTFHAVAFGKDTRLNRGQHVLHAGRAFPSRLTIPVIPRQS
ncbi:MAG: CocE/NonD family hydrolase [Pseudomonadota bacterium]